MTSSLLSQKPPKTNRSQSQSSNRNITKSQNSIPSSFHNELTTRETDQSIHSSQLTRRSLRDVVKKGFAPPPSTIIKPFNLSRSNFRRNSQCHIAEEQLQRANQVKDHANSKKSFIVLRSDKPLTIPKEFK